MSFIARSRNGQGLLDWIGLDWIGLDWIGLDWQNDAHSLIPFGVFIIELLAKLFFIKTAQKRGVIA